MAERRRFLLRFFLLVAVPVAVAAGAAYVYTVTGRYVTTDNAYVKSRKVAVSPDISGRVISVAVGDNQVVGVGQLLFEIDPSPYHIALAESAAEIADVRQRIGALRADYRQARAELKEAKARLRYFDQQVKRYRKLSKKGIATASKYEEMERERASGTERVAAIRERINKVLVSLGGRVDSRVEDHPWYLMAKAEQQRAAMQLGYTQIISPIDGVVSNLRLERGEFVEKGDPVFVIVESDRSWIEVNLKETQLTHVEVGQEVSFVIDAYPDFTWRAIVESISPATGAEFSVLPPQNASGNWVKVVQRVPVRLKILPNQAAPQLRAGMTASVSIDTKRDRDLISLYTNALAFVGKKN